MLGETENNPFTLMIDISMHSVYSSSSRVRLFSLLSYFWRYRVELMRSVIVQVKGNGLPFVADYSPALHFLESE